MSACSFSLPFSKPAEEILAKAKQTVEAQGGNFTGDQSAGAFDVSVFGNTIKGSYTVSGSNLNIEITDKPFLVPCNMIESFLRDKLT